MRVFITGAGGGLGRAMAVECAKRGYDLFLTDVDEACLGSLRCGLARRYGIHAQTHVCDLTDSDDIGRMMGDIDAQGLRFDMMLGIAGVDYEGGFLEREMEKIRTIVRLNVEATLSIVHAVLQRRVPGHPFYLVFVSSLASMYPIPLKATYAASKRFLLDFSIALGQEMRHHGRACVVAVPGRPGDNAGGAQRHPRTGAVGAGDDKPAGDRRASDDIACAARAPDILSGHTEPHVQHSGADVATHADRPAAAQPMGCCAETVAGTAVMST